MRRLFFILAAMLVSGAAMLAQPRNPYYEREYKADLQVGVSPARNYIVANSTLTDIARLLFRQRAFRRRRYRRVCRQTWHRHEKSQNPPAGIRRGDLQFHEPDGESVDRSARRSIVRLYDPWRGLLCTSLYRSQHLENDTDCGY